MSGKTFQATVDAWNRGEIAVLCGHPASIGHGLNLQSAGNHICWYTLTWNREHYDQFNARVLRQGNEHQSVFVHRIMAEDTLDTAVAAALRKKDETQTGLLNALLDYAKGLR
jgi:SNF2 family DNA or RNA helicase